IGGFDGMNALATSDIYDPSTGTVSAGPLLSTPRQGHTATTQLDGKILVVGGNNGSADVSSAEFYDTSTGAFLPAGGALSTARRDHLAFLLPHNGTILIVGGNSNGTAMPSVEQYLPWANAFSVTTDMSTARLMATGNALSQDGLLLVAGGKNASGATLSGAELYGFATVKTDLSDYAPGETVTITGSGWQPGETVTLHLQEVP